MSVGRPRAGVIAEINVTPMADVMIVLLIIFMVTAPIIAAAPVRLPEAVHTEEHQGERLELVIGRDGSVAVDGATLASAELLREYLYLRVAREEPALVLVQADRDVTYGLLEPILRACREARVARIALAAQLRPGVEP